MHPLDTERKLEMHSCFLYGGHLSEGRNDSHLPVVYCKPACRPGNYQEHDDDRRDKVFFNFPKLGFLPRYEEL